MKALKRALTAFVCLSLLCFTGMGASADKSPVHTDPPSGGDSEQIQIQQVYAAFNDQIARQAEDIYGGAYITEDNELVLCLTEGTGPEAFEKASLNIREKFRETIANSTKTKAIPHSGDAKLRIKAVKYSLKQLQSTQAALTDQMEELGIQALWSDPETNRIHVEFTAGTADGQAAGGTAKAQATRLASKKQALCAALPSYAADMFLFKEADPDGETVTTAKIYVQGGTSASSPAGSFTVGFGAQYGGNYGYLIPGHAASVGNEITWNSNKKKMGKVTWRQFSNGVDCAFVQKPAVGLFTDSWKFSNSLPDGKTLPLGSPYTYPPTGLSVSAYGSVSGYQTGKILASNYTEKYNGVTMTNMLKTSYKAVHGDSGAPVWSGNSAVGMQSASHLRNNAWYDGAYSICMPMSTVCNRTSSTNFWLTTF